MPIATETPKLSVEDIAARFRADLIPLSNTFAYFSTIPIPEEDLKQYLHEPIAAISPAICGSIPAVGIVLVPFLERGNGKHAEVVNFDRPSEARSLPMVRTGSPDAAMLVMAVKDTDIADYHYTLYNAIAGLVAENWAAEPKSRFTALLRTELAEEVHGEVDERSWHLKQGLRRRQANIRSETKLFREYVRRAFEDTLTLYLHGTCCDIDVETGPRQMPSCYLRRRLELLMALYPPPEGYAVFPEQLNKR